MAIKIMGIDAGQTGGVAFISPRTKTLYKLSAFYTNKILNPAELQDLIIRNKPQSAVLEKQQARSGQGGQANIMINYGIIYATIKLCGIPLHEVTPQKWKKHFGIKPLRKDYILLADEYRKFLAGGKAGAKKNGSVYWCLINGYTIPPKNPTGNVLHDGIADAICIANYGMSLTARDFVK